ncbi:SAM-dependent methyltransferase [Gemella sp. GH3]|uniref:class I SAM-dependent methyltransferase n=1 Tax=unclassified Gemella TaxID=2624949 RepID=UPI0015D0A138|nr:MULTISPECIES: SAM-dependent methyltransferase [unclassified Gemella]MBF0713826.1 SAM-dependent methyltransferase [Gemella sp. GH3.1]NYS50778.1 SAM-dependent methyltransferase [Gemella sp. GH3]
MFENIISDIWIDIENKKLIKFTASNFRNKSEELEKIIAKLVIIKKQTNLQLEYRYKRIIKHINIPIHSKENIINELKNIFLSFRDINIQTEKENIDIKISKKYKITVNRKIQNKKNIVQNQNKKKNYLLDENMKYDFLIALGIQTKEGKIKKDKFYKFRQINKYLEYISYCIKEISTDKAIKILDFGSGKSYLTFSVYYYLTEILNKDANIIGIDLKKEVIDNCNKIAKKLNFNKLNFIYGDVANFSTDDKIDMVISLHACDTATDIAILKSISWKTKVILAVPCCQKELNSQLNENYISIMLKHGIIKEKFASLLTDSIRSEILNSFGYKSNIMEFISEENTPKNLLIRAIKKDNKINKQKINEIKTYLDTLQIKMMLVDEAIKLT